MNKKLIFYTFVLSQSIISCGEKETVDNPDPQTRIKTVAQSNDATSLAVIFLTDDVQAIREQAWAKLVDKTTVGKEFDKITDDKILEKIVRNCSIKEFKIDAVKKIKDEALLVKIASLEVRNNDDLLVSGQAVSCIKNNSTLYNIYSHKESGALRGAAIETMTDQQMLIKIATESEEKYCRKLAFGRIDKELRKKFAFDSKSEFQGDALRAIDLDSDLVNIAMNANNNDDIRSGALASISDDQLYKKTCDALTANNFGSIADASYTPRNDSKRFKNLK